MEVELPLPVPTSSYRPPRNSCPAGAEMPFPLVSEEVGEQVQPVGGGQCAKAVNSVRRNACVVKAMGEIKNE